MAFGTFTSHLSLVGFKGLSIILTLAFNINLTIGKSFIRTSENDFYYQAANLQSETLCPDPLNIFPSKEFNFQTLQRLYFRPCIFAAEGNDKLVKVEVRAIHSEAEMWDFKDLPNSQTCRDIYNFEPISRQNDIEKVTGPFLICKSRKLRKYEYENDNFFDIWDVQGRLKFYTTYNIWEEAKFFQIIFIIYEEYSCSRIQVQQYAITSWCNATLLSEFSSTICAHFNCSQETAIMEKIGFLPDKNTDFPRYRRNFIGKLSVLISNITSLALFILVAIVLKSLIVRYLRKPYGIYGMYPNNSPDGISPSSGGTGWGSEGERPHVHHHRSRRSTTPPSRQLPRTINHSAHLPVDLETPPPAYDSLSPPSYSEATKT